MIDHLGQLLEHQILAVWEGLLVLGSFCSRRDSPGRSTDLAGAEVKCNLNEGSRRGGMPEAARAGKGLEVWGMGWKG